MDESENRHSDTFDFPWSFPFSSDIDPLSEDLQNKILLSCHESGEIFSNELPDSPASIPPFDIVVDDTKWKDSENRTHPHPQSSTNQAEVFVDQGIIENSNSAHYS